MSAPLNDPDESPDIDALIEASSLGTPAAKAARDSADDETVERILKRVAGWHLTAEALAIVESGLTVRQAHEIRTGCSADTPCAQCRRDFGERT